MFCWLKFWLSVTAEICFSRSKEACESLLRNWGKKNKNTTSHHMATRLPQEAQDTELTSQRRAWAHILLSMRYGERREIRKKMDREGEMCHTSVFWEKSHRLVNHRCKNTFTFSTQTLCFYPVKSTQKCKQNKNEGCQLIKD